MILNNGKILSFFHFELMWILMGREARAFAIKPCHYLFRLYIEFHVIVSWIYPNNKRKWYQFSNYCSYERKDWRRQSIKFEIHMRTSINQSTPTTNFSSLPWHSNMIWLSDTSIVLVGPLLASHTIFYNVIFHQFSKWIKNKPFQFRMLSYFFSF